MGRRQTETKNKKGLATTISPQLAAELFFSSPLIYVPDGYISSCLNSPDCLYSFIQTSSYYFPAIASMAKFYISQQNISTYEELEQYLFPIEKKGTEEDELMEWNNRYSDFIPSKFEKKELNRGIQLNCYQKNWCKFVPPGGYYNNKSYWLMPIAYWADCLRKRSDSDHRFLEAVCSNFPTELWKFSEDN